MVRPGDDSEKLANQSNDDDEAMPTIIDDNSIELENKFDQKTWNDFLNDLSMNLADCFLNNSVETTLVGSN